MQGSKVLRVLYDKLEEYKGFTDHNGRISLPQLMAAISKAAEELENNDEQINALADYFTGPLAAHFSINMQLTGRNKEAADRYFALRESFGVRGYIPKSEAVEIIRKSAR